MWRGLLLFVVLLLWCLLLDRFGFLVPSVLCYVILAILADQMDRPTPGQVARHIMLGIAVSGLFYVSFSQALSVPLPKGLLPF